MDGALHVRFSGPLVPLVGGLRAELIRLGYAPVTVRVHLQLWAHVSRWLGERGLQPAELTQTALGDFLVERRRTHVVLVSPAGLAPGLDWLRRTGVVPPAPAPVLAGDPVETVLQAFQGYLQVERGVLAATGEKYADCLRPFLTDRLRQGALDWESLAAGDISRFTAARLPAMAPSSAKSTVTALRSLLRYLHVIGELPLPLAAAVPSVASWRLAALPTGLDAGQVQALLGACDGGTAVGRRDLAVLLLLSRLGLRSVEVATLAMSDLDWRDGTLLVHGKGNRLDRLPLPVDVGGALVAYLQHDRPAQAAGRSVFVRARAPYVALDRKSVGTLVGRAATRAGLGVVHAHRLRHTVASAVLAAGAPLPEVAQLLRHRSIASTAIYAKVDHRRLAELARPWPAGGQL